MVCDIYSFDAVINEMSLLQELSAEAKKCHKCPLAKTRMNVVFGVGNESAELMLVGEAPGYYEDRQGEPFVGAAGHLLDELLGSIGLRREEIYIANVLKCRPPQNRDPLPEEIEVCKPFLLKQIEIIKPKVICTLGNFATRVLLQENVNISRVRGKPFFLSNYVIFPLYHPAAALHASTNRASLEEDFQKLRKVIEGGIKQEPKAEQMGLF